MMPSLKSCEQRTCYLRPPGREQRGACGLATRRSKSRKSAPLERWRGVHVDGLDGLPVGPPAMGGGGGEVEGVAGGEPELSLVLEVDEEVAGDHINKLLARVRVEAFAPCAGRDP